MASKEGAVLSLHPKLVARWARRYIILYRTQGSDVAKKWALEFLPAPERAAMTEKVNQILHKDKKNGPK